MEFQKQIKKGLKPIYIKPSDSGMVLSYQSSTFDDFLGKREIL